MPVTTGGLALALVAETVAAPLAAVDVVDLVVAAAAASLVAAGGVVAEEESDAVRPDGVETLQRTWFLGIQSKM